MFARLLAVALTLAFPAYAQTLPEPQSDTVSDYADVLDATVEGRISRLLVEMREATGVQMVVVTLPGIAAQGGAGMRIEDYGKALFNAWGVGGAERNDGIMLLLDTEAREARIALGAGYDPVYDGRAARVLSTAVLPSLRAGNYAEGIEAGVVSARERLITPFLAGTPVSVSDGFEDTDGPSSGTSLLLGLGAVAGLAGFGFWRNRRARRTCPKCGALTLERSSEVILQPTPGETGLGMQHLSCSACGFNDHKSYPIPWSRREGRQSRSSISGAGSGGRSSGSGRGFGGGRSSGGGASGKW
jgi:uncharacterized protein